MNHDTDNVHAAKPAILDPCEASTILPSPDSDTLVNAKKNKKSNPFGINRKTNRPTNNVDSHFLRRTTATSAEASKRAAKK